MNTKQTEIGEIPADWEVVKLGECLKTAPKYGINAPAVALEGNLPVYIRITDISDDGFFMPSEKVGVRHAMAENYLLENGDLLLARTGASVGKSYLYNEKDGKLVFAGFLIKISPDNENLDSVFLSQYLKTEKYWQWVATISMRSGQPGINATEYAGLQIPLPPFPEQTAIAAILSDTDRLLTTLRALIGKKRAVKTAAMQQLLSGRLRLPGFAATGRLKNSELGEIPEDWEVVKIKEFTDCTAGGTPSTVISEYWNGGIPWMNSGELHLKQVYDVSGRITELGLNNSSTSVVPKNSVLIGLAGQGKTRGTVAISRIPLCTNQSIAAVFPNNLFCSEYLFYNLENRYEELRSLSTGDGGRGGLNLTIIRNLAVPFPSHPEQTAIAQTLSDMDSEIAALEARAAKLAHIKQGLMQNLLNGKIRVNAGAA